jgi:pimeloyl-ACP methyl ester carboxylesterase
MKKIIFITLMVATLLGLNGCQGLWYQFLNITVDIAPDRFVIEEDHEKLSIPIVTSHPLGKKNYETEYLIIMIHGTGLNANKTFETGLKIIESLDLPINRFWVLAPQIIEGVKLDEKGLLFWDRRWRSGGMSLSTGLNKDLPSLCSFEVIDRLIGVAVKLNPGIRRIIILGHSAGGQFIVRYAAINSRHEFLERQGISIRYVVANSSSYPYLDKTRFHFNSAREMLITSREELMNCPSYNEYKYGLEKLYGYAETLSPQIIRTRLLTRPVMFVLGKADTDRDWGLDKSCEADVQGKNRYERGLLYKLHLRSFVKGSPKSQHIWLEIPEVGHEATEIFTHPRFITELKTLDF